VRKPLLEIPTLTAAGAVVGRPRKPCPPYPVREIRQQPPQDVYATIHQLAVAHKALKVIAHELGTNPEMLRRWMTDDPQLTWAYDSGKAVAEHELKMCLVEGARENERLNLSALVVLKCAHGWREGDPGEQASRVNITFNLPGALSPEDFMKQVVSVNEQRTEDKPVPRTSLIRT
jgi:hypothetical protein